ncbi:hypothetical protein O3P69_020597 [Scylla paramamosain]|uniref:Uncharacterized protein n=1 Tax=Scylla paramamosain TaxID=85552 RepID=A0AAW0TN39_SCYPA
MDKQPLGVDAVLGITGISALGGVVVKSSSDIQFCGSDRLSGATSTAARVVNTPDCSVHDGCADQLREWHRHGVNVSVLDLRKAYLQLRIEQQVWLFQAMMVRERRGHATTRSPPPPNSSDVPVTCCVRVVRTACGPPAAGRVAPPISCMAEASGKPSNVRL